MYWNIAIHNSNIRPKLLEELTEKVGHRGIKTNFTCFNDKEISCVGQEMQKFDNFGLEKVMFSGERHFFVQGMRVKYIWESHVEKVLRNQNQKYIRYNFRIRLNCTLMYFVCTCKHFAAKVRIFYINSIMSEN